MGNKIESIGEHAKSLFDTTERHNRTNDWEQISRYFLPFAGGKFTHISSPGTRPLKDQFANIGIIATRDLAANLNSTLTNPAIKWADLRFISDDLANAPDAVEWLSQLTIRMHNWFNESNLYTELAAAALNFTTFGNMAIFVDEKSNKIGNGFNGFSFTSLHLANVAWEENYEGQVDTVSIKIQTKNRNVAAKWPKFKNRDFIESLDAEPYAPRTILLFIRPRDPAKVKENSAGISAPTERPFEAFYIDEQTNELIEETGYYEFPCFVGRFQKRSGEVYGYGPGDDALSEVKVYSKSRELFLEIAGRNAVPPLFMEQRNVLGQLDLRPRSVNIVRSVTGLKEFNTNTRMDISQINMETLERNVQKAFFLDKLMLPPRTETGEMTAFEIEQRLADLHRVLGPTANRLTHDVYRGLTVRSAKMLVRQGVAPPVPDVLREYGVDIDIEFVNQLARAQQMQEVTNIQGWYQQVMAVAQAQPTVLDIVDGDMLIKKAADLRGIPHDFIRPDEEVEKMRQQRQQMQATQQALEAGVKTADIASKTGDANA